MQVEKMKLDLDLDEAGKGRSETFTLELPYLANSQPSLYSSFSERYFTSERSVSSFPKY